jgi:hypothetical protein
MGMDGTHPAYRRAKHKGLSSEGEKLRPFAMLFGLPGTTEDEPGT